MKFSGKNISSKQKDTIMNRISKKKTLSRYIIKKYLSFLIVILLLFSLIRNLSALLFFGSDNMNFSRILDANALIR